MRTSDRQLPNPAFGTFPRTPTGSKQFRTACRWGGKSKCLVAY